MGQNWFYNFTKYWFGIYALDTAPYLVKKESLASGIAFLKKEYKFFRPAPVKFLLNLYNYLLKISTNLPIFHESNSLILHFCCWGKSYTEKVERCLLPSLLSKGNLPEISKKYKITLLIHCDMETKKRLSESSVLKEIKKYAHPEFIILPTSLIKNYHANLRYSSFSFLKKITAIKKNIKYLFLGGIQTHAFEIAVKNKSYISFLMPDLVLSDMFFTKIFSMIQGKKLILSSSFRTDYSGISNKLEPFFENKEKTRLAIPASELTHLQVSHMHSDSKKHIISESTNNFIPCAHLIFETPNGFILRAFHYHPILLDCYHYDYKMKPDYFPIDNSALNQILSNDSPLEQQIAVCDNSSEVLFIEVSDPHKNEETPENSRKSNYNQLVQTIGEMIVKYPDTFDTPLNRYFSSIKNKFESPTIYKEGNFLSDDQFFADLKKHLMETGSLREI